jgi:ppGpp synthetase/RelA/SpoT-type nucleotidyltranferase
MMEQHEFEDYLKQNQAALAAWGKHVCDKVNDFLSQELGHEEAIMFVKITPKPRLKSVASALGKISRKGYKDPVNEMTDLVGVRFVVLLSENIKLVSKIIESCSEWVAEMSKDYQLEIDNNPKLFDYQSKHYEIRPIGNIIIDDIDISKDICCELQIRTLLQHAYAELVHDSVYKPVGDVPKSAERQIARSMALMETTDELFCSTMELLNNTNKKRNEFLESLISIFNEKIGSHHYNLDLKINYAILDEFRGLFDENTPREISKYIDEKKYVPLKIKSRAKERIIFAQPSILFVYWLTIEIDLDTLKKRWPLPGCINDLNIILSDTGNSTTH